MCQQTLWKSVLIVGMLIWTVGCSAPSELPTAIPTAAVPPTATAQATRELPPTRDLATATAQPTPEPSPTLPIVVQEDTPTPVIGPVINIDQPVAGHQTVMGSDVTLSGFAQVTSDMAIHVGLTSAAGQALASAVADVDISQWQATLTTPAFMTGGVVAHAVIVDAGGNELARDSVELVLTADRQVNDSYVTLFRPQPGSVGVAGHNFFMDGQLWRQGGGNLQVAVLMDGCQENVADVFFQLGTSSYWQGYVILPEDISGPGCAAAWVGEPGSEEWRAAMVPITILPQDDPMATGVMISNPRADRNYAWGETILVTGVAYNMRGRMVNIEVLMEENGQVVAEAEDDADFYGYWSAEVTLQPGLEGEATVRVTTGDRAQPDSESTVTFNIVSPQ